MRHLNQPLSPRNVLACCAATLVGYVGIVHEVVGTTLYPDGPSSFGGPIGWHAAGVAAIVAGGLLAAGALRWLRVPVVPLAAAVGGIGGVVFIDDALSEGSFHFFALTLVIASAVLAVTELGNRQPVRS